jgi:hypothetical protein
MAAAPKRTTQRARTGARRAVPAGKRGPKRGQRSSRKSGTFALMICGLLVIVALPLCLVLFAGMAPTITAAIVDRHPKRYLARTVGVLNLAGMVHPLISLMRAGINVIGAATVLFDPYQWLWMYGAAAIGWVCYLGAPPIARTIVEGRAARLDRELQRRADALIEEWGDAVTGRRPEGDAPAAAGPGAGVAAAAVAVSAR